MKVARKLTLAILAVMVAVLSLKAVERVVRDRRGSTARRSIAGSSATA